MSGSGTERPLACLPLHYNSYDSQNQQNAEAAARLGRRPRRLVKRRLERIPLRPDHFEGHLLESEASNAIYELNEAFQ